MGGGWKHRQRGLERGIDGVAIALPGLDHAKARKSCGGEKLGGDGYAAAPPSIVLNDDDGKAPGGALVGGGPLSGGDRDPAKLIGNYWPYATTIFDFTRRAMPWQQPKTLTDDEVYALTAYILALNKIIGENDAMNAETLPKVRMPNRDGFIPLYPSKH